MKNNSQQKGFILLITVLIFSAITLVILLGQSERVFSLQSINDEMEYSSQSVELARSCRNKAMLSLALDPGYQAHEVTEVLGSGSCTINLVSQLSQTDASTTFQINTSATVHFVPVFLQSIVVISGTSFDLQSSNEVQHFI